MIQTVEQMYSGTVQPGIGGISRLYEEFALIFAYCKVSWMRYHYYLSYLTNRIRDALV